MQSKAKLWWVYLLACRGRRTYAGVAVDVAARFSLHRSGKGAKFTRANPPLRILGAQSFATQSEAQKAEYALKQLDRSKKLSWARQWKWQAKTPAGQLARDGLDGAHHFRSSGTTKSL